MPVTEVVELAERVLPVAPAVYGIVALVVLLGLGLVAAAFRSVGSRH